MYSQPVLIAEYIPLQGETSNVHSALHSSLISENDCTEMSDCTLSSTWIQTTYDWASLTCKCGRSYLNISDF